MTLTKIQKNNVSSISYLPLTPKGIHAHGLQIRILIRKFGPQLTTQQHPVIRVVPVFSDELSYRAVFHSSLRFQVFIAQFPFWRYRKISGLSTHVLGKRGYRYPQKHWRVGTLSLRLCAFLPTCYKSLSLMVSPFLVHCQTRIVHL